ncbi:MAG: protocatechuate 3,4-dioxygenase [Pseudomonadota bacterium]
MTWQSHDYDDIPGTYVFDGENAHRSYALNKLLFSFNSEINRNEFAEDENAYADKFGLNEEQKKALLARDFLTMIRIGANIYYVAKLAVPSGVSVQDAGAAFQGITTEEFKAKLLARREGLVERLEKEGFWNG